MSCETVAPPVFVQPFGAVTVTENVPPVAVVSVGPLVMFDHEKVAFAALLEAVKVTVGVVQLMSADAGKTVRLGG